MFGAPVGLEEHQPSPKPSLSLFPKNVDSNQQRTKDSNVFSVEQWWYGEVVWWRCFACYIWLAFTCIAFFFFVTIPFGILNFYSLFLLYFCAALILFAQQSLRSVYRGEKEQRRAVPSIIASLCLFFGSVLSVITIATADSPLSLNILSSCLRLQSYGGQPVPIYCLNEPTLCLLFFSTYLSIFTVVRFKVRKQHVLHFPLLQRGRWFRMKARIPLIAQESFFVTFIVIVTFYFMYFLWGSILSGMAVHFFSHFVTEAIFLHPLVWEDSYFTLPLIGQLSMASLLFVFVFQITRHLTDVFLTQSKPFDDDKMRSNIRWLLEGLCSTDNHTRFAALLDLVEVSKFDAHRRKEIYESEQTWDIVLTQSMNTLNEFTTSLADACSAQRKQFSSTPLTSSLFVSTKKENHPLSKEYIFGKSQAVIWAAQSLGNIVALASVEDQGGVVQRSDAVLKSLNSLLSCRLMLSSFVELDILPIPAGLGGNQILHPFPKTLGLSLKSAIYRITSSYHQNMPQINEKLHPALRSTLLDFIEYQT